MVLDCLRGLSKQAPAHMRNMPIIHRVAVTLQSIAASLAAVASRGAAGGASRWNDAVVGIVAAGRRTVRLGGSALLPVCKRRRRVEARHAAMLPRHHHGPGTAWQICQCCGGKRM